MALVYVFDLDGVLFRGQTVIPEAPPALERLRAAEKSLFFLTNNSTQPRSAYVEKLTAMGMPCLEEEIVTSASATADYLSRVRGAVGKTVFAVGGAGIKDELNRVGIHVRTVEDAPELDSECEFLVAGWIGTSGTKPFSGLSRFFFAARSFWRRTATASTRSREA